MESDSSSSSPLLRKKKIIPISDYNTNGTISEDKISSLPSAKNFDVPNFSLSPIRTESKRLKDDENVEQLELSPIIELPRTSTPTDKEKYLPLDRVIVNVVTYGSISPTSVEIKRARFQKQSAAKEKKKKITTTTIPTDKEKYPIDPIMVNLPYGSISPTFAEIRRVRFQEQAAAKEKRRNIIISTAALAKKLRDYESSPSIQMSKSSGESITMDTSSLAKKMKYWLDQQKTPKSLGIDPFDTILGAKPIVEDDNNNYNSLPVLTSTKRNTLDVICRKERDGYIDIIREEKDKKSSDSSKSWYDVTQTSTKSTSFRSFTSNSVETNISTRRGINSMSILLSPMRSDDREPSPESIFETSPQLYVPSNSYISSTTSLWDLVFDKNLDYTAPTPSDTTGSEDYNIVFERRYQKDIERKQQIKYEEKLRQTQEQENRRKNFHRFSIDGITWSEFSCDYIRFSMKPKDIFPGYFSSKRKYTFSMSYTGRHWNIKTWRIPARAAVLKVYSRCIITDENIAQFFEIVVAIILREIELERDFKEQRERDYFAGEDLDLNESDIELFLNEEERQAYKERCQKLWQGMMSPPK